MFCRYCGEELPEGTEVCTHCKQRIASDRSKAAKGHRRLFKWVVLILVLLSLAGWVTSKLGIGSKPHFYNISSPMKLSGSWDGEIRLEDVDNMSDGDHVAWLKENVIGQRERCDTHLTLDENGVGTLKLKVYPLMESAPEKKLVTENAPSTQQPDAQGSGLYVESSGGQNASLRKTEPIQTVLSATYQKDQLIVKGQSKDLFGTLPGTFELKATLDFVRDRDLLTFSGKGTLTGEDSAEYRFTLDMDIRTHQLSQCDHLLVPSLCQKVHLDRARLNMWTLGGGNHFIKVD